MPMDLFCQKLLHYKQKIQIHNIQHSKMYPSVNQVKHKQSTKSEPPHLYSYQNQQRVRKNFTGQGHSKQSQQKSLMQAQYNRKIRICRNLEMEIKRGKEKKKVLIEQSKSVSRQIEAINQKLFSLEFEAKQIQIQLKKEKDELKIFKLERRAQLNAEKRQEIYEDLKNQKNLLQKLKKRLSVTEEYIDRKEDSLIQEEFLMRLPSINPQSNLSIFLQQIVRIKMNF